MNALKIAKQLIHDGRINNQDDWHEMKLELQHEFNERGMSKEEQEKALKTVKDQWY